MIASAMLYTVAVTLLLLAGASAFDYLMRALGAPTRFVWAVAMLTALALSTAALFGRNEARTATPAASSLTPSAVPITVLATGTGAPGSAPSATPTSARVLQRVLTAERGATASLDRLLDSVNVASLDRWNTALVALWIAMSGGALVWLCASLVGMRRMERTLSPTRVDEHSVLVSSDIGPATLGVFRSRIVVPRWVLSLSAHDRNFILAHEREHVGASDPALLYAAALSLALQPWNPALWALLGRLRLAIEADCDRRVLRLVPDPRSYGRLLVAVYQRSVRLPAPYVAFVERPSNLELRIRRMTGRPRLLSFTAVGASILATLLLTAAWTAPAPARLIVPRAVVVSSAPVTSVPSTQPTLALPAPSTDSLSAAEPAAQTPAGRPPLPPAPVHLPPRHATSCMFAGRGSGTSPSRQPAPPNDCSIDGAVLVFALDSTRVLVAARDTADAAVQAAGYWVFDVDAGVVPDGLSWSTEMGHVYVHGTDVYVASPSPGVPALVFGLPGSDIVNAHADALHPTIRGIQLLRQPGVTWNILRRIPSAHRCPAIYVDSVLVQDRGPQTQDCFIVGGQMIHID